MMFDTSVLVEWLEEHQQYEANIASLLMTGRHSIAWPQLGELAAYALRHGKDVEGVLEGVRHGFDVTPLTDNDFVEGARIRQSARDSGQKKFSLMDGMILACARRSEQILVTLDNDFTGLEGTEILN